MQRLDTAAKRFDVTTNHIVNDVHNDRAEPRSVERVGGEGPPTSGEPYPVERPPISRSARPCTLPAGVRNLLYRPPIAIHRFIQTKSSRASL